MRGHQAIDQQHHNSAASCGIPVGQRKRLFGGECPGEIEASHCSPYAAMAFMSPERKALPAGSPPPVCDRACNHPIGIAHQLFQLGGDHQQPSPSAHSVSIRRMISAWAPTQFRALARRESEIAVGSVANVKQHFLLIAAGEKFNRLFGGSVRMPSWRIKRSAISCCSLRK